MCTRIGMMMEDASAVALTIGGLAPADRPTALLKIERALDQINALVSAAKTLLVYVRNVDTSVDWRCRQLPPPMPVVQ